MKIWRDNVALLAAIILLTTTIFYFIVYLKPTKNKMNDVQNKIETLKQEINMVKIQHKEANQIKTYILSLALKNEFTLHRLKISSTSDITNTLLTLSKTLNIDVDRIVPNKNESSLDILLKINYLDFLEWVAALKYLPWLVTINNIHIATSEQRLNVTLSLEVVHEKID